MTSSQTIDFRLRANKGIERAIAFEVLGRMQPFLGADPVFVGLGSLWFVDFRLAHRLLGVETMLSIESNESIARRAEFNKPYRSIEVVEGSTTVVIPSLLEREDLANRPWVVWLDYDSKLTAESIGELQTLAVNLPEGSAVLTTFNVKPGVYANYENRVSVLHDLFGAEIVGSDIGPDEVNSVPKFGQVITRCALEYLQSVAIQSGRSGSFVPTTSLRYRDSVPMATVGGVFVTNQVARDCQSLAQSTDWPGIDDIQIEGEPLTMREIDALCTLLPSSKKLTRSDVKRLGFELSDDQISLFQRHYLRYPFFAEIVS